MKKWAKYLLLFLALSVLVGLLAVTVLAEGETTETEPPAVWTPEKFKENDPDFDTSTVYWAIFQSETAYKNGAAPKKTNLDDTSHPTELYGYYIHDIQTSANGLDGQTLYIRLYQNTTYNNAASSPRFARRGTLTVDLAGYTLTVKSDTKMVPYDHEGQTCHLYFKNGTINNSDTTIYAEDLQSITFDNVNIKARFFGYWRGGSYYFINSTAECTYKRAFLLGDANPSKNPTVSFVNSTLKLPTDMATSASNLVVTDSDGSSSAIFNVRGTSNPTASLHYCWDIYFDKNSSIESKTTNPVFLGISQSSAEKNYYEQSIAAGYDGVKVYFEDGFAFNNSFKPDASTAENAEKFSYYLQYANAGTSVYTELQANDGKVTMSVANLTKDANGKITAATPIAVTDWAYVDMGDGLYAASSAKTLENLLANPEWTPAEDSAVKYAAWLNENFYLAGYEPRTASTKSALISADVNALITNSENYIVFFDNITNPEGYETFMGAGTLVINCNGKSFIFEKTNMKLDNNVTRNVTIKNGTLSANQLNFRYNNTVTLIDMTCNVDQLGYSGAGNFTATDSTVNIAYGIYLNNDYGNANVQFNNCKVNFTGTLGFITDPADINVSGTYYRNLPISINEANATNDVNISFDGDCVVTTPNHTKCIFAFIKRTVAVTENNISINFADGVEVDSDLIPDQTYVLSEGGVKTTKPADGTISIGEGNYWYAVPNGNNYTLYSTDEKPTLDSGKFTANLFLSTNFVMNFKADPTAIAGVLVNRKAVESLPFYADSTKVRYEVPVMANAAAENVFMLVGIKQKDDSVRYYPLNYSVLKYAEQIMATNDDDAKLDDAKLLVSAAMEYVKAAYTFDGKTAPAFTGVTVTPATNNATAPDTTDIRSLVRGAQLDLGSGFKLRFNLAENSNGTLYVDGVKYDVVDGKVGDLTYVEVDRRAYDLANAVVLSVGGASVEYGIANYAKSDSVFGTSAQPMVDALYTYCCIAKTYNENK